jgi:hypothetical protein
MVLSLPLQLVFHVLTHIFSSVVSEIRMEKLPSGLSIGCFLMGWILFCFVIISGTV